jgi:hypothetical protein
MGIGAVVMVIAGFTTVQASHELSRLLAGVFFVQAAFFAAQAAIFRYAYRHAGDGPQVAPTTD